MTTEAKNTVGQALAATKFFIVATDRNTGETVYCQQSSRLRDYRFAPNATPSGMPSARRITREQATKFIQSDARELLARIEGALGNVEHRWIDDWRMVPVSGGAA